MSTINIDLAADTILNVMIGQQDENEVREVVFDFSGWYTTYGSGTISLAIQRPKDEWPYEGTLTVDSTNHKATWEISDTDTAYAGTGQIQLSYKVGDAKKKSVVYRFTCHKSLGALGSVVTPVQIQTFIDEVEEALQTMDGKLDDMEDEITDVKSDLNYFGKPLDTSANRLSLTFVNNKYINTSGAEKSDSTMYYTVVQGSKGDILEIDSNPNGSVGLIGFSSTPTLSFPIEVVKNGSGNTTQHYTWQFDRDGYAVITGKTGSISVTKIISTLWDNIVDKYATRENLEFLSDRTENLIDIFNIEVFNWFPNSSKQKISENENTRSVFIPVDSEVDTKVSLHKGINSTFRVATFTTEAPSVGDSYSSLTNIGSNVTEGTITIDSTIKCIMVWYWYNDPATPLDVLESLSVIYGSTPSFIRSRIPYHDDYYPIKITEYSADFNSDINLQTGSLYFNVNDGTVLNAPLGLTNGAFHITNSSAFGVAGRRAVLQRCYIQSPVYLRTTVWYRFIDAETKAVYVDWNSIDKAWFNPYITIFGDSITAGYPQATNDSYHWWAYLKRYFDFTNFAQSGAGIIYVNSNKSGTIFADQFSDTTQNHLIIFMGTNDYGNDMPLGTVNDSAGTSTVCAGLKYIIEKVMTTSPALSIIGILPLNRSDFGTASTNWAYGTANGAGYTLGELCDALKTIYESYGIPVIDNRQSVFQKLNMGSLTGDGLHPNINGYRKLAQHLGGEIMRIIAPI